MKAPAVRRALVLLEECLGAGAFHVTDYWDADNFAIGIASRNAPRRLVYLCCLDSDGTAFDVVLEDQPDKSSDLPYAETGRFTAVDLDGLVEIVRRHLLSDSRIAE